MTTAVAPRIDKLVPCSIVELDLGYGPEKAIFVEVTGNGDDRRAKFRQLEQHSEDRIFGWEAYRFDGRWAYGSSADRIRVLSVLQTPADLLS